MMEPSSNATKHYMVHCFIHQLHMLFWYSWCIFTAVTSNISAYSKHTVSPLRTIYDNELSDDTTYRYTCKTSTSHRYHWDSIHRIGSPPTLLSSIPTSYRSLWVRLLSAWMCLWRGKYTEAVVEMVINNSKTIIIRRRRLFQWSWTTRMISSPSLTVCLLDATHVMIMGRQLWLYICTCYDRVFSYVRACYHRNCHSEGDSNTMVELSISVLG